MSEPLSPRRRRGLGALLGFMGLGSLANAAWMFVAPGRWYTDLPAAVPDFGPLNEHFVRDIACAFMTVGIALVWSAFSDRFRLPLVATATIFFVAHAVLHVYDTLRGAVDSHHWWLDLPGVYLPAVLLLLVARTLARRPKSS